MLESIIGKTVRFCTDRPWSVILAWVLLAALSGLYVAQHFAISTDINKLISRDLPWRQREIAFDKEFPGQNEFILVVLDAPTQERATEASALLVGELQKQPKLFRSIQELGGGEFFARNGFLFMPTAELEKTAGQLGEAAPLIGTLADNPSLVGLTKALSLGLTGVQRGQVGLDDLTRPMVASANTIEDVLAGRRTNFSWHALLSGEPPQTRDLRRLIQILPALDYAALEPGKDASDAIRNAAATLHLSDRFDAKVRLTGPTPIADEEFATVQEGALVNGIGTLVVVLVILWLALRSAQIIFAVFVNLFVGLCLTGALGLMMVGALNMISVAFAVLFIGLGVDFGIQYAVRYRSERHEIDDLKEALLRAARHAGPPLTLAAAAVAAGFFSFLPTTYRGVSELGQIAGTGMIIAFVTSITLLPALLLLLNPPGEGEPVGYRALAPVDRFLERRRVPVLAGTAAVVLLGLPLLTQLSFDFNPLHLRSDKVESIATYLDLRRDPQVGGDPIDIVAPSQEAIEPIVKRLASVPEVSHTMTLANFIPDDQDRKLAAVARLKEDLDPALEGPAEPTPNDEATVVALRQSSEALTKAAAGKSGTGADAAKRLSADLVKLADAGPAMRERTDDAMVMPLKTSLDDLRNLLKAEHVTTKTLPPELLRDWTTASGRTRVQVFPKDTSGNNDAVRAFARAVLTAEPTAIGGPVSILESGDTIIRAFVEAGAWAIIAIAILLWIVLRRLGDVLLTLIPLLVAGAITLEITVLIGLPLNFANIIALPLMLGLGVAFKIYYIMAWRRGQTGLLQTSLTRAVIFSAATTATAFGSLWLSSHPGTSSMGKLLALSLVCTLAAAVLFQPALMGKPRSAGDA